MGSEIDMVEDRGFTPSTSRRSHQFDVRNAFVHGYMEQPSSFVT